MGTSFKGQAYDFYDNMLIAADMIANVEDRHLIYAVMKAAEDATLKGVNPRKVFLDRSHKFKHIKLDMNFKNWKD